MRRRLSRSSRISRAAASPLATRGRSASFMRTSTPACAIAVPAMPDPMNPAPTTPRRVTTAGVGGLAIPKSFLRAVVAKKIWTSLRETSVTASCPNSCASRFRPSAMPCFSPRSTACHALRRGDGDVLEDGRMDQLVHDAQTERLLGAFDLAREDDVEGRAGANQPGEPLAAARPRENAELHFREA